MLPLHDITRQMQARGPGWLVRAAWPLVLAVAVGLLMMFGVAPLVGGFISNLLVFIGINIILAVSLTVVNGFTGQFSLGHAGFMAVGGYVAAGIVYYGSMRLWGSADFAGGLLSWTGAGERPALFAAGDVLFLFSCLAGGLAAAGAGYVVGLPSLRLRGDYLAIVTLGFGEIVRVILQGSSDQIQPWRAEQAQQTPAWELAWALGGPKGFNLLPTYGTLFWVFFWTAITVLVAYRLKASSTGRAFLSIREDEIAARAMGVNLTRYKVRAFVLSSFFAGVAGALYAMQIGAISAGDLNFVRSFDVIIMVVLGGLGSISGAALAAILLTVLPEVLRDPAGFAGLWPWVVGTGVAFIGAGLVLQRTGKAQDRFTHLPKGLVFTGGAVLAFLGVCAVAAWQGWDLGKYRLIIFALALILMMILRPQGLLGVRELWEKQLWHGAFGRRTPAGRAPGTGVKP